MTEDPDKSQREEQIRDALGRVDPEFLRQMMRGAHIAQRLRELAELLKLDAVLGQSGGMATPAQGAQFIRGQAGLLRENSSLHAELADIYDEMAAVLDRKT